MAGPGRLLLLRQEQSGRAQASAAAGGNGRRMPMRRQQRRLPKRRGLLSSKGRSVPCAAMPFEFALAFSVPGACVPAASLRDTHSSAFLVICAEPERCVAYLLGSEAFSYLLRD